MSHLKEIITASLDECNQLYLYEVQQRLFKMEGKKAGNLLHEYL